MCAKHGEPPSEQKGFSRRSFVKGLGTGTLAAATISTGVMSVSPEKVRAQPIPQVSGPGATPVTLIINRTTYQISVEPRETLLEVLRNRLDITGPKLVCDRGSCGACTVYLNGLPAYACMTLAIEVQGVEITTIEGLAQGDRLHPAQEAIVEADAIQCGFCTPGFAMSMAAALERNPSATPEQVRQSLTGHLCRCGTYVQMNRAIELALQKMGGAS
ncbi:MAG: (2Fe-2S)-binding protein [Planctomycetota bacterium]|jgi:xanthine dehydrogenase YagT iron-sulfur-binding subunit